MPNARQRGTGVRIRSEAKAAAADRLLLAAQDADDAYLRLKASHDELPRWRWRSRRSHRALMVLWLERFRTAITSAQDVAKKGRHVEL